MIVPILKEDVNKFLGIFLTSYTALIAMKTAADKSLKWLFSHPIS